MTPPTYDAKGEAPVASVARVALSFSLADQRDSMRETLAQLNVQDLRHLMEASVALTSAAAHQVAVLNIAEKRANRKD